MNSNYSNLGNFIQIYKANNIMLLFFKYWMVKVSFLFYEFPTCRILAGKLTWVLMKFDDKQREHNDRHMFLSSR